MTALKSRVLSGRMDTSILSDRMLASIALTAISLWIFPQVTIAQSTHDATPSNPFEINQNTTTAQSTETLIARDIPGSKLNTLHSYLLEYNSPLADHVEVLLMQPEWKHVLSISFAESTFCKFELGNNCWGIGGAKYHRYYPTYAEGIVDANALIEKYHDGGLTEPRTIMRRWVGWNNQRWIRANEQVLAQIDSLGL